MGDEPIYNAIKELREELARLDHVIAAVEAIAAGKPRRGRPPKFIARMRADQANGGERAPKESSARGRSRASGPGR